MDQWEKLEFEMLACKGCSLCKSRTNVVCGVGNRQSAVMLVGEAPGQQEDLQGEPFVGRGGQLLDRLLFHVDLSRHKNVYIANMLKCRPPNNRDPLPEETAACAHFLRRQIELVDPAVVVCLGRIAAVALIDSGFKITKDHGKLYRKDGRIYMGVFHPAYVLRSPGQRGAMVEDFVKLRETLTSLGIET